MDMGLTSMADLFREIGVTDKIVLPRRKLVEFFKSQAKQQEANKLLNAKKYTFQDLVFFLQRMDFDLRQMSLNHERTDLPDQFKDQYRPLFVMFEAVKQIEK